MSVSPWIKIALSALSAFLIGAGTPLLAAAAAIEGSHIPQIVWITSAVSGLLYLARDVRNVLDLPPSNGRPGPPGGTP